jgi:type II secretory pathway component PulM
MESEDQSLLGRLEGFLGPRYPWFVLVVALVLLVLLALAGYAQGASGGRLRAALWMVALSPVIVVYILLVHPLMHRRWQRAMRSLHALAPGADGAGRHKPVSHRSEWAAMVLGSLFGLAVAREIPAAEGWLRLYSEATSALMFALLAAAVYGGLARARHLAAHSRAGLELNVFDGHLLTPFAQWGQSLTLVFVGGISLSLLFQSYESLRSVEGVITYGVLVIVALTLFFMSVWTIHVALAKAQQKELARVRRDLAAAREALQRERADNPRGAVEDPYLPVVVCGMYEKQVLEASTWPFNPTIVGRLFASAVAPLSVYVLKLAFGVSAAL